MGDHGTNIVSSMRYGGVKAGNYVINDSLKYRYDANGNISEILENGLIAVKYTYDALNRLIREDNRQLGKTVLWTYDNFGNILYKRTTAYTVKAIEEIETFTEEKEYLYDGKYPDRLVGFGDDTISYNANGMPTNYRGKTLDWTSLGQLKSAGSTGFSYDGSGRRIRKGDITGGSTLYKNEVSYTPSTWEEWYKPDGFTIVDNAIQITAVNQSKPVYCSKTLKSSTKYGLLFNVPYNTMTSMSWYGMINGTVFPDSGALLVPDGATGNFKGVGITPSTIINNSIIISMNDISTGATRFKDIRLYELPAGSQMEWDFDNLTADQLNSKYLFVGKDIFTYDFSGRLVKSNGFEFYYDGSGLSGFEFNSLKYIYRKNLQGDITQILDNNGNTVVKYSYDAWGNHTTVDTSGINLGNLNPFRYRGYYYDTETGLYYLQTRYYDPETGRFISQDDVSYLNAKTINGLNLYAYCLGNPIRYVDHAGRKPVDAADPIVSFIELLFASLGQGFRSISKYFASLAASIVKTSPYIGGSVFRYVPNGLSDALGARANTFSAMDDMFSGIGKAAKGIGIALLVVDCVLSVINNATNPNLSLDRKITDSVVDVGLAVGTFWAVTSISTALGNLIPIPGVGAAIGFIIGVGIWAIIEFTPVDEWIKDGVSWIVNEVGSWFK